MDPFVMKRLSMVEDQLQKSGIEDRMVLEAMRKVPGHLFVPEDMRKHAYEPTPLPVGDKQTISQPYIVGLMSEALAIKPEDTILEIGTGSGYQAAIISLLAKTVHTIERHQSLYTKAKKILKGYKNVILHHSDGSLGLPSHAPFDGIIVTAAATHFPRALGEQLKESGRICIPIGGASWQELFLFRKFGRELKEYRLGSVLFVPLIGDYQRF